MDVTSCGCSDLVKQNWGTCAGEKGLILCRFCDKPVFDPSYVKPQYVVSEDKVVKQKEDKPGFFSYLFVYLVIAFVIFLVVAFIHDLFTGQLPGSGDPCSQYETYEAQEFCADNLDLG